MYLSPSLHSDAVNENRHLQVEVEGVTNEIQFGTSSGRETFNAEDQHGFSVLPFVPRSASSDLLVMETSMCMCSDVLFLMCSCGESTS